MELDSKRGFRSSFDFIPEGGYAVPRELRDEIMRGGFEVGVHDLRHDGKLYRSRQVFAQKALRINRYLKDWGAVGFRSGFMFHKLERSSRRTYAAEFYENFLKYVRRRYTESLWNPLRRELAAYITRMQASPARSQPTISSDCP